MELETKERDLIQRYLLGSADPSEVEPLEERLLADNRFLEEFSIIQNELIDDYVCGTLSTSDAERLEKHFLSTPRRAAKVSFARALAERSEIEESAAVEDFASSPLNQHDGALSVSESSRITKYWPIAAGLALMLLAGLGIWKMLTPREVQVVDKHRQQFEVELAQLNDPSADTIPGSAPTLSLKPVAVRGPGDDRRVVVKDPNMTVVLHLELASDDYHTYRALLQTDDGSDLATISNLSAADRNGRVIRVSIPSRSLASRGYQLTLSGLSAAGVYEAVGTYSFQVVKADN